MTTIKTFADELAAVVFHSVETRYPGIPKELYERELPAQWVDMPSAAIRVGDDFGTFDESGTSYTAQLFVAVSLVTEGLPEQQREAMLDMAEEVELWAKDTTYEVLITTAPRIPVGSREYRGVVAKVTRTNLE